MSLGAARIANVGQPLGVRGYQPLRQNLRLDLGSAHALAGVERANAFHERFLEGAANGHHFSSTDFICGPQVFIRARKFLELPLWNFNDHVVERRLKNMPESYA